MQKQQCQRRQKGREKRSSMKYPLQRLMKRAHVASEKACGENASQLPRTEEQAPTCPKLNIRIAQSFLRPGLPPPWTLPAQPYIPPRMLLTNLLPMVHSSHACSHESVSVKPCQEPRLTIAATSPMPRTKVPPDRLFHRQASSPCR
jgi:hypothetical protein